MGPPNPAQLLDHTNASILWALWHNVDPSELVVPAAEDRADTISVQSYQVPYKHTPSYSFPNRKPQYAEVVRIRAKQNAARVRYCSTAPALHSANEELIEIQTKPSMCKLKLIKRHVDQ